MRETTKNKRGTEIKKGRTYRLTDCNETLTVTGFDVRELGSMDSRTGMIEAEGIRTDSEGREYESWAYIDDLGTEVRTTKGIKS